MLRGELYIADDRDNAAEFARVQELLASFNGLAPGAGDERDALLRRILRYVGEGVVVRPPFFCEYGAIRIGDGTFINVDAVMLDVMPITIGAACQIGTRVQLLTATPSPRSGASTHRLGIRTVDHHRRQRLAGRRGDRLPRSQHRRGYRRGGRRCGQPGPSGGSRSGRCAGPGPAGDRRRGSHRGPAALRLTDCRPQATGSRLWLGPPARMTARSRFAHFRFA